MGSQEISVAPALGAKLHDAEEHPERNDFAERPQRHVVSVLPHHVATVRAALAPVDLALDIGALVSGSRGEIVAQDAVPVFAVVFGERKQPHLGEVLHIERHDEKQVSQHAIGVREQPKLAEVEPDILAVEASTDMFVEVLALGIDAKELAFGTQVPCRIGLGAKVEGDTLVLHVGDLLVDSEQGLGVGGLRLPATLRSGPAIGAGGLATLPLNG